MKKINLIYFIVPMIQLVYCDEIKIDSSYEYPDSNMIDSQETHPSSSTTETAPHDNTTHKCTEMKFYCESCTDLVMCIDTEYGYSKQYIKCPSNSTCLRGHCTVETNPLCDGTAAIPFKCHVPGIFPDPFDCQKYHFCVPQSPEMVNSTLNLKHTEHKCQKDEGVEYSYDPLSHYCKNEISNGCEKWPVPLCRKEAHTDALEESDSIFFVCEKVNGHLYPHLYACPHGEQYNQETTKCEKRQCIQITPIPELPEPEPDYPDHIETEQPPWQWRG